MLHTKARKFKPQLRLFLFCCVPSYISVFPAISLCSQIYLCVPSYISGVRFLRIWLFFNPTSCLREWCMLGVFLLLAFTRLGHECRDLLSLWQWDRVRTNVNPKGTIPSSEKFPSEEDGTRDVASSRTVSPTHYQPAIPAPNWDSNLHSCIGGRLGKQTC